VDKKPHSVENHGRHKAGQFQPRFDPHCLPQMARGFVWGLGMEILMSSIDRTRPHFCFSKAVRPTGAVAMAMLLGACAQSSVVTDRSALHDSRSAAAEHARKPRLEASAPAATNRAAATRDPWLGLASYYEQGNLTASGERFDARELTAAHPTLPFGTRLRVTNIATGRSVMVRVNDRGPFVRGRVLDVSYSAAKTLGMVGRGIAKVKMDVVH